MKGYSDMRIYQLRKFINAYEKSAGLKIIAPGSLLVKDQNYILESRISTKTFDYATN